MLSVAYKNSVAARRTAWRAVVAIEQKDEAKDTQFVQLIREYKSKIEGEVVASCNEILGLLDKSLLPKVQSPECEVFYLKMKGDYYRYTAECTPPDKSKVAAERAQDVYKTATEKANTLPTTDPIRLGRLGTLISVFERLPQQTGSDPQ